MSVRQVHTTKGERILVMKAEPSKSTSAQKEQRDQYFRAWQQIGNASTNNFDKFAKLLDEELAALQRDETTKPNASTSANKIPKRKWKGAPAKWSIQMKHSK